MGGKERVKIPAKIGDRTTSDVIVRLRIDEGRDQWFYCHSEVLTKKSKYFAERLSDDWPTCQILDSRYCVEVYCQEPEFNSHVTTLRLFYTPEPHALHGVRNALGILQVAIFLGSPQMAGACVEYLEGVPWEEAEEEEILRTIPSLGSQYEQILARLQPVDQNAVVGIFVSAIRFATSSPPPSLLELKSSTQEQLEYMLTEDDDAPLVSLEDEVIKSEVRSCAKDILARFDVLVETLLDASPDNILEESSAQHLRSLLCDISWICQMLNKMEMMKDLVPLQVTAASISFPAASIQLQVPAASFSDSASALPLQIASSAFTLSSTSIPLQIAPTAISVTTPAIPLQVATPAISVTAPAVPLQVTAPTVSLSALAVPLQVPTTTVSVTAPDVPLQVPTTTVSVIASAISLQVTPTTIRISSSSSVP